MTASEHLRIQRLERTAVVTLVRPEARNALTPPLWAALAAGISELDRDDRVAAIVLTGEDPAFCAGFDLRGLAGEHAETRRARLAEPLGFVGMLPPHDTPVIGAVNGAAVTGGLELALACDVLVASERARFADTHARVGAMPGGGLTILLPARVGPGRARLMSLTGDFVDAPTAVAWGLADELVPHEALVGRALELATAMGSIPAEARSEVRRMYTEIGELTGRAAFEREQAWAREWMAQRFDQARLAGSRADIVRRGREQQRNRPAGGHEVP